MSFNIRNTARNKNKKTLLWKKKGIWKNNCENNSVKIHFLCFNSWVKGWVLEIPTAPQYWVNLACIIKNVFSENVKTVDRYHQLKHLKEELH